MQTTLTVSESLSESLYPVVPATTLEMPILISLPTQTPAEIQHYVEEWIEKQGQFWPVELTASVLCQNLQCIYLTAWLVNAAGTAHWSASIGNDYLATINCAWCNGFGKRDNETCNSCFGTGRTTETRTNWHSANSGIDAKVIDGVVNNVEAGAIKLQCGDRLLSVQRQPIEASQTAQYQILHPMQRTRAEGMSVAQNTLQHALSVNANAQAQHMGDHVKGLSLSDIQTDQLDAKLWLYPIFLSRFAWSQETSLLVQVDGLTGTYHIDTPRSIRSERWQSWTLKALAVLLPMILILGAVVPALNDAGRVDINREAATQRTVLIIIGAILISVGLVFVLKRLHDGVPVHGQSSSNVTGKPAANLINGK